MGNEGKEDQILIRVQKSRKENWKKLCKEKNLTLTDLLTASVENRILTNVKLIQ